MIVEKRHSCAQLFGRNIFQDGADDDPFREGRLRSRRLSQYGSQASFLTQGRSEAKPRTRPDQIDRLATTDPCRKIFHSDPHPIYTLEPDIWIGLRSLKRLD